MDEHEIRALVDDVKTGRLSRRRFVQTLVGLGLTAPLAAQMLTAAGVAAQPKAPVFTPTRRGGGGPLRVLWWQAPTLLNPHFATGTKDQDGSRIFYEPLAGYDPDGSLVPVLAADIPTVQNGGLGRDGTWVVWNLKKGVQWHDGKPFTADDVVFNWEYAADPATAAVTVGAYRDIDRVERLDEHSVKVVFKQPTPYWYEAFCQNRGHHPQAPVQRLQGRQVARGAHQPQAGRHRALSRLRRLQARATSSGASSTRATTCRTGPFFDTFEMKGGGDAASAARAVLQTGEYDFAWNMQIEDDVLRRLEQGGKGRAEIYPTGGIEHIQCNFTDPGREVDGERASLKTTHPTLADPAVRQALAVLVDRASIAEQIYGRGGQATGNYLNAPSRYYSRNTRWEFNVDKANQILDAAGWKRGADGIRAKDGKKLKFLYQTSINAPRQKTQAIVKQACAKAGIEIEIKSVVASVFFASDPANPDTYPHFYADLQMYNTSTGVDPLWGMRVFISQEVATKDNKWSGRNITRWRNEDYDRLWKAAETEMDPVKRAAQFIRMNDMVIQNGVVIPVNWRNGVAAAATRLRGIDLTGWDSNLWRLPYWHKV